MADYQKAFIENLKFYRKKKGITQSQLAEACNVSNGTIGNIECGITKPSFDLILLIADRLGIKPELLFCYDGQPEFNSKMQESFFTKEQLREIKSAMGNALTAAMKNLENIK